MALNAQPVIENFKTHPIAIDFSARTPLVLTFASSVTPSPGTAPDGGTVSVLFETSPNAWAERDLQALFDPVRPRAIFSADTDLRGPVSLAAVYERNHPATNDAERGERFEKRTRVVVFGDANWIKNSSLAQNFNRDFILSAINWSTALEGGLTFEARSIAETAPRTPIRQDAIENLFYVSFIVPELLLLFGLLVWWRRRTAYA